MTNIHQPFLDILDEDYQKQLDKGMKIKATNPYSGESEMLTQEEHKLYIEFKEAEEAERRKAEIQANARREAEENEEKHKKEAE